MRGRRSGERLSMCAVCARAGGVPASVLGSERMVTGQRRFGSLNAAMAATIPQRRFDSLNVAMAGTVLAYELSRGK